MSYQSPIDLIVGQMNLNFENEICKAVQNVGVCVDKEELLKALQYDRKQYQKGYSDRDAEIVRCKDCKYWTYGDCGPFCPYHHDARPDWYCASGEAKE